MKPIKLRAFSFFIALILALSLTACSNGNSSTSLTTAQESITSESPTETPSPEPTSKPTIDPAAPSSSNLIVHYIDVGQGDSILIQLPNGETMLIDGGESSNATQICDYMQTQSITKIDYLVATHPHSDHIGGLPDIIDSTDIGAIYMPRVSHTTQIFERLLTSIENKGLQIEAAKAGVNILNIEGLVIDIVAPVHDSYNSLNDYSAVILIKYNNTNFLFMGDAESVSEGHITADIKADVLKVGHHGSNISTSSTFLQNVNPDYAIISVGAGNSYGHPADEILVRLNDSNISVYRTDLQGTIVFTSDGDKITVNTMPTRYQSPDTLTADTTSTPEPTSEPTETPKTESIMVWLSATGTKYHSINNCGNMNPNKARQVTLETAKKSYDPCSKCNPPE